MRAATLIVSALALAFDVESVRAAKS